MSETKIADTRRFRQKAVGNAIDSSLLEGVKVSARTLTNLNQYIEGKTTLESLIVDAKRRYARAG